MLVMNKYLMKKILKDNTGFTTAEVQKLLPKSRLSEPSDAYSGKGDAS